MSNHPIRIKEIYQTSYLATREAAEEIVRQANNNDVFDFTDITFTSGSFVDEFLTRLAERGINPAQVLLNLNPSLKRLFQAIIKRRRAPAGV